MPEVKIASTAQDRERIFKFRYQVYVREMGKCLGEADHGCERLCDSVDDWGHQLYVEANDRIVGAARMNWFDEGKLSRDVEQRLALPRFRNWLRSDLTYVSRMMVDVAYRQTDVAQALFCACYVAARRRDAKLCFIESRPPLLRLYQTYGFRRYTSPFLDHLANCLYPLLLVIDDLAHLRAARSSFANLAVEFVNSAEAAQWAANEFGDGFQHACGYADTADVLPKLTRNSWLASLPNEVLVSLAGRGAVASCPAGATLTRSSETSDTILAPLSGRLSAVEPSTAIPRITDREGCLGLECLNSRLAVRREIRVIEESEVFVVAATAAKRALTATPTLVTIPSSAARPVSSVAQLPAQNT